MITQALVLNLLNTELVDADRISTYLGREVSIRSPEFFNQEKAALNCGSVFADAYKCAPM